jgi:hypothetical protein
MIIQYNFNDGPSTIFTRYDIKYNIMWPFKRKKTKQEHRQSGPICSHCKSTNTRVISYYHSGQPENLKIWRGQRYSTCRCYDCGQDFYIEEQLIRDQEINDNAAIDNEEELRAAEEELRNNIENEDDHTCR